MRQLPLFWNTESRSVSTAGGSLRTAKKLRLVHGDARVESGVVHIVGAGPGDPELLTLKALRLIQNADVIIYDRLIGEDILNFAREGAERVYVGKAPGAHAKTQQQINDLMIEAAAAGRNVVRLKGGDPFIFGRGGEEQAALLAAGIRVEIVPGITAATGCAAASGIPLTHRQVTSAVTFVTGHGKFGTPDVDWAALASGKHTLVIYMGVGTAGDCARNLMDHGRAPSTPVAVVENGTCPGQRILTGALAHLGDIVCDENVEGPALLIIGDVVARGAHTAEFTDFIENIAPLQTAAG